MKQAMFICLVLSAAGTLLRLFMEGTGAKAGAKAISLLCSVLAALTLAGAAAGKLRFSVSMDVPDKEAYYRALSADTLDAVCAEAENQLAARLCAGIAENAGHTPLACYVTLDREALRILAVTVVFDSGDRLFSSYEVKQYVRAQCGADAEVEVVFA